MLLDSNIIIYAAKPEHPELRQLIDEQVPAVSAISYIEALGYHRMTPEERLSLEKFFQTALILPISPEVLENAVRLRQARKMSLGDAVVAGTALAHGLTLITRNVKDFDWIAGLTLFNPFTKE